MTMDETIFVDEIPLPLQIKDLLSVIFGKLSLPTIGKCSQVSKKWKDVVDTFILLEEIDLEPKNSPHAFKFACLALEKFPHAKKIGLPASISTLQDGFVQTFFKDIYPMGVKDVTTLALPPSLEFLGGDDQVREELAHLIFDPLPKSCVHFKYVSFWPEFFTVMTKKLSENMRSLDILLKSQGIISGPWDSLIDLVKRSPKLETLHLNYFENASFYYTGRPNFEVLSDNLTNVLQFATNLQRLNIPPYFKVDKIIQNMASLPNLTYLCLQDQMAKTLPNTVLEKCTKLRHLHLHLDDGKEQYSFQSTNLQTLLIDSSVSLNSVSIDCPNLEVLKFLAPRRQIKEVHVVGEHKLEDFTSKMPIISLFGNFNSVKVADQNTLLPRNHQRLGLMPLVEKLMLENVDSRSPFTSGRTQLIDETIDSLTQLKELKSLDLVKITKFESALSAMSQLTKLVIRECNTYGNIIHLDNLPFLQEFQLLHSKEISTVKITACKQITNLVLFTNDNLRTLQINGAPNIEKLDMRNCTLNLESWKELRNLTKLKLVVALVVPISSYEYFTSRSPRVEIYGKTVSDRVYEGGTSILGTVVQQINWISKEEYEESGPSVRSSRPY